MRQKDKLNNRPATVVNLVLSLLVLLFFAGAALLHYYSTAFLYAVITNEASAELAHRVRWTIFAVASGAFTLFVLWWRFFGRDRHNKVLNFLFLIPVIALLVFSNWGITILLYASLIVTLYLTQMPVLEFSDRFRAPGGKWSKAYHQVSLWRAIALLLSLVAGFWFVHGTRQWAYRTEQLDEINRKGIIADLNSVQPLLDSSHPEYVRISGAGMRLQFVTRHTIGSGDDAYTLEYAALTDRELDYGAIQTWPLWVYLPSQYPKERFPMIFQVSRCIVGKSCKGGFVQMVDAAVKQHFPQAAAPRAPSQAQLRRGQELVELSPELELSYSRDEWWQKIQFRLYLLVTLQLVYSLSHWLCQRQIFRQLQS
ncbi:hypothetical protein [Turneriella parva]|nr:hypothetical protein [Turneriella parva]